MSADDDDLAARSRAGDPAALATLYHRHGPALLDFLTRYLRNPVEAEDVLHETFLRLFKGRGGYRAQGRFRAWLFAVASRIAIDRLRRGQRHRALAAAHSWPGQAPEDPLQALAGAEIQGCIDDALATLPESYAAAFHLRVREGFSYREIAEISGAPLGTLRSRVHHALRTARQALRAAGLVPSTDAPEVESS